MSTAPTMAHWVRANHANRVPRTHVVLDAEATITETDGGQTHTFRCAVTSVDRMHPKKHHWLPTVYAEHDTTTDVWRWIDGQCRTRERTVVVAHNAGYDLRITDGLRQLDALGWKLVSLSMNPGATWGTWRRGDASLVLVDSLTWLPMPLELIGRMVGHEKPDLPTQHATTALWFARCLADVEILRRAWLRIVHWVRGDDVGNWRPTGAGAAWNHYRHRHMTHRLLAHDDVELRARERRAAWTGRAEAWQLGRLSDGPWFEYDFRCAYATVARECWVPTVCLGTLASKRHHAVLSGEGNVAALCDATVSTDAPTLPTHHDGQILWPTGTFSGTWWSHELRNALDHGAHVEVTHATGYSCAPALRQWAEWVFSVLDAPTGTHDPVLVALVKHWSRALIGRFGTRYAVWAHVGDLPTYEVGLGWEWRESDPVGHRSLQIGHRVLVQSDERDGADTVPSVMSWIMAESRVRLWRAMTLAGLDHVVYVDTDALVVDVAGMEALEAVGVPGLRRKAVFRRLEVLGTRKLVADGALRAAGVSRGAVRSGALSWQSDAWDGLVSSLNGGAPDAVNVRRKVINLGSAERRRQRTTGGSTKAWVL